MLCDVASIVRYSTGRNCGREEEGDKEGKKESVRTEGKGRDFMKRNLDPRGNVWSVILRHRTVFLPLHFKMKNANSCVCREGKYS